MKIRSIKDLRFQYQARIYTFKIQAHLLKTGSILVAEHKDPGNTTEGSCLA